MTWTAGDEQNRSRSQSPATHAFVRSVAIGEPTAAALEIMSGTELPFLPVRGEDGRCVGVVLRKALERGCQRMGHDIERCEISNHLYTDIRRIREGGPERGKIAHGAPEKPIVVVDDDGAPLRAVVHAGGEETDLASTRRGPTADGSGDES